MHEIQDKPRRLESLRNASVRSFLILLSSMALFAAIAGATSTAAIAASPTPSTPTPPGRSPSIDQQRREGTLVLIQNTNSGLCLVAQGTANGAPAFQTRCNTEFADQLWQRINNSGTPTSSTGGQIRYKNFNSGKCIVVQGTAAGAQAFQFTCGSFADQKWTETTKVLVDPRSGSKAYSVKNVNSQKCLLVQGSTDGTRAVQTQCADFKDQQWTYI